MNLVSRLLLLILLCSQSAEAKWTLKGCLARLLGKTTYESKPAQITWRKAEGMQYSELKSKGFGVVNFYQTDDGAFIVTSDRENHGSQTLSRAQIRDILGDLADNPDYTLYHDKDMGFSVHVPAIKDTSDPTRVANRDLIIRKLTDGVANIVRSDKGVERSVLAEQGEINDKTPVAPAQVAAAFSGVEKAPASSDAPHSPTMLETKKGRISESPEFASFDPNAQKLTTRLEELKLGGDNGEVRNIKSAVDPAAAPVIAKILQKGVTSAKVRRFDSVQNAFYSGANAIDVIEVRILHPDNSTSIIVSYLKADGPYDLSLGLLTDRRPQFTQIFAANDPNSGIAHGFRNGDKNIDPTPLSYSDADRYLGAFVKQGLAANGMKEVDRTETFEP